MKPDASECRPSRPLAAAGSNATGETVAAQDVFRAVPHACHRGGRHVWQFADSYADVRELLVNNATIATRDRNALQYFAAEA
ncbi:hypothetical protein FQN51_007047 [Onygenales sp. PD_10]|nr:hypothetical protein FQN51_007047 [Onygenales sp. PD_10]